MFEICVLNIYIYVLKNISILPLKIYNFPLKIKSFLPRFESCLQEFDSFLLWFKSFLPIFKSFLPMFESFLPWFESFLPKDNCSSQSHKYSCLIYQDVYPYDSNILLLNTFPHMDNVLPLNALFWSPYIRFCGSLSIYFFMRFI